MIAKIYPDGHPDLQGKKDPKHPVRYFDIRKLTPRECYALMGVPQQQIEMLMQTEKKPYTAWVGVDNELAVFGLEPSATRREVEDAYREAIESLSNKEQDDYDEQTDDPDTARIMAEKAEDAAEEVELMRQNYQNCCHRIMRQGDNVCWTYGVISSGKGGSAIVICNINCSDLPPLVSLGCATLVSLNIILYQYLRFVRIVPIAPPCKA